MNDTITPKYLINKIVMLKKDNSSDGRRHYRVSDIVHQLGLYWKESIEFILNQDLYKGSILREYIESCHYNNLREKNMIYLSVLTKIINEKIKEGFELPRNDELVIHLRLGDACEFKWFLQKDYCKIIKEYIDKFNIKKVTFCTAFHYGNYTKENMFIYTNKKHQLNILKLTELFIKIIKSFNIIIDIKSSINVDEDIIYMVKARYLVEDNRGFSKLIKALNLYPNNSNIPECIYKNHDNPKIMYSINMKIAFIHIGKTGGSSLYRILEPKLNNFKEYHLNNNYSNDEKYIIWIRNPISRFVSAFNHLYYAVNVNKKLIKSMDLTKCLLPCKLSGAIERGYVFSNKYDSLVKYFKSANHLAESLTSDNLESRTKAHELISDPTEHLYKGIGWYLNNGDFVKNNNDNIIFVGRQEYMKDDIKRLSSLLNVELDENKKIRENVYVDKSMKYLSPLAIKNIIEWYKDTDYAALKEVCNHGWIDSDLLSSYYIYNLPADIQPPNAKSPTNNIIYPNCDRPECTYKKHDNPKNNGGTHCCLGCKRYNTHSSYCKK